MLPGGYVMSVWSRTLCRIYSPIAREETKQSLPTVVKSYQILFVCQGVPTKSEEGQSLVIIRPAFGLLTAIVTRPRNGLSWTCHPQTRIWSQGSGAEMAQFGPYPSQEAPHYPHIWVLAYRKGDFRPFSAVIVKLTALI